MEDATDLQDWEFLSDSDDTHSFAFEEIIHSDYFAVDSNKPLKSQVGFQGIEPRIGDFDVISSNDELGVEEFVKGDSFIVDDAKLDVGFEVSESRPQNYNVVDSEDGVGAEESRSESEVEESHDLCSDSSSGMSSRDDVCVIEEEKKKKVLVWWKVPLEIVKMCALRARTVWSIPISAAFIGILMVGRRLYKMKHKSPRLPPKIRFDDKKATSQQLLVRAARLNEVVVRRVPAIRSPPMLTAGGVTSWPLLGLL